MYDYIKCIYIKSKNPPFSPVLHRKNIKSNGFWMCPKPGNSAAIPWGKIINADAKNPLFPSTDEWK